MDGLSIFVDNFIREHPWQQIKIGKESFYYLSGGQGRSVFLIFPGSGQDALSCYDLISGFEDRYKVIALQYRSIYSMELFFEYVIEVLKKEKADKVVLYGLSLGGFLAQHFLRKYPQMVQSLIISHAGSTKSKTIRRRVAMPAVILYPVIRVIPQRLLKIAVRRIANFLQSRTTNVRGLYGKYSSLSDYDLRVIFAHRSSFTMADKKYLKSIFNLGKDLEKKEKKFNREDLSSWNGKILILRTDNDPLAQDDGIFKEYYPDASVVTFSDTGHLTPFIRSKEMIMKIKSWLVNH